MARESSNIIAIPELDGKELPRVTHVIDLLNKPWFGPWSAKLAAQYTKDKIDEIITQLENEMPSNEEIIYLVEQLKDGWKSQEEFILEIIKIINKSSEKIRSLDTDKIYIEAKREHKRKGKEAANLGTKTHKAIERWIKAKDGDEFDIDSDIKKPFGAFIEWWNDNRIQPILIEKRIWSLDGGGWTGRLDIYDGYKLEIWDWKTSKDIYEKDILQSAAYFGGLKQWATEGIPSPKMAGILKLDKETGFPEPHEFTEEQLDLIYPAFVSLTQSWWHMREFKKILRSI